MSQDGMPTAAETQSRHNLFDPQDSNTRQSSVGILHHECKWQRSQETTGQRKAHSEIEICTVSYHGFSMVEVTSSFKTFFDEELTAS